MAATTLTRDQQACFQLKTSFLPSTILQLIREDLTALEQQIRAAISKAPLFFAGAPVVIDLEKVSTSENLDFEKLKAILMANGLVPIGVRLGSQAQMDQAARAGLSQINLSKTSPAAAPSPEAKQPEKEAPVSTAPIVSGGSASKLVATPIRSGAQVYAKEGDLVVLAQVSPGAELLADGHIHVYGTLRGRALAGVRGNKEARIFCQNLEAELISIAGYYLTKEEMLRLPKRKGMIQISLDSNEQIKIESV